MRKIIIMPLSLLAFLILLFSISVPVMEHHGFMNLSSKIHNLLGNICHQMPTRSLKILGLPMRLCSRCFGIYLGIFIVGIYAIGESKTPTGISLRGMILIIPMLIDVFTQMLDLRTSNNNIRLFSGFLCGFGIGLILYQATKLFIKDSGRLLQKFKYISQFQISRNF